MPRLNPVSGLPLYANTSGVFTGVGDSAVMHFDRHATQACWLDDHRIVAQIKRGEAEASWRVAVCDSRAGGLNLGQLWTDHLPQGAHRIRAGGGVIITWGPFTHPFGATWPNLPAGVPPILEPSICDVDARGWSLFTSHHDGRGLWLFDAAGAFQRYWRTEPLRADAITGGPNARLDPHAGTVAFEADGVWIWEVEMNDLGRPPSRVEPTGQPVMADGWLVELGPTRLTLRDSDGRFGLVIAEGDTFAVDAVAIGDDILVGYSTERGESPQSVRVVRVNPLTAPLVDLDATAPNNQPPPIEDPPMPDPSSPPDLTALTELVDVTHDSVVRLSGRFDALNAELARRLDRIDAQIAEAKAQAQTAEAEAMGAREAAEVYQQRVQALAVRFGALRLNVRKAWHGAVVGVDLVKE